MSEPTPGSELREALDASDAAFYASVSVAQHLLAKGLDAQLMFTSLEAAEAAAMSVLHTRNVVSLARSRGKAPWATPQLIRQLDERVKDYNRLLHPVQDEILRHMNASVALKSAPRGNPRARRRR